jgi:type IV pilus assembly protein PilW
MLKSTPMRRGQRGLSIVELMVGVAIGLFVVAGAAMLLSTQLSDNRQLLLETQLQQDLRATADIISRELRRAGHWGKARDSVWVPGSAALPANPYTGLAKADGTDFANLDSDSTVLMSYSSATDEMTENDIVDAAEQYGFRLNGGVIQSRLGACGWQALTDANTLRVTAFQVTMDKQQLALSCAKACAASAAGCPPVQEVRAMRVDIAAEAANDPNVRRSVRSNVRLRNDAVTGACPA